MKICVKTLTYASRTKIGVWQWEKQLGQLCGRWKKGVKMLREIYRYFVYSICELREVRSSGRGRYSWCVASICIYVYYIRNAVAKTHNTRSHRYIYISNIIICNAYQTTLASLSVIIFPSFVNGIVDGKMAWNIILMIRAETRRRIFRCK